MQSTRFARPALAAALLAAALSACGPDAAGPLLAPGTTTLAPTDAAAAGQQLARALASSLDNPAVRVRIRNAMRQSPFTEHKLVLQTFANTPEGRFVLAAAAAKSGTTEEKLRGLMAQLPPMDFYVPLEEQRLSWRGGSDVVLGLNLDVNDPGLTAYAADGSATKLDARLGTPAQTVLLLHPAEPRNRSTRSTGPGETIQDAAETASVAVDDCVYIESVGGSTPLGSRDGTAGALCSGGGDTGGGGGSITYPTTKYLRKFKFYYQDGWGKSEVKFFMWVPDFSANGRDKLWDKLFTDVNRLTEYTVNYAFTQMGQFASVEEMDQFSHDRWGDSYASTAHYLNGTRGFGASGQPTVFVSSCGAIFGDSWKYYWECTSYADPYVTVTAWYEY